MLSVFHQMYSWLSGVDQIPAHEQAFQVKLGNLNVGLLRVEGGEWVFSYSDEFRSQNRVSPIVDFPSIDRDYRSKTLWPFFALRIPSVKQPQVQEFIARHSAETVDAAVLLKEFGARSAANPFLLVPLAA